MHTRNFICGVVIVGIVLICKKKLSWIVLLFICPSLYGSNIHRFSEFKNFNSTYYNSETGKPALSFYFKEISKESPKIGFFKFSIPFFFFNGIQKKGWRGCANQKGRQNACLPSRGAEQRTACLQRAECRVQELQFMQIPGWRRGRGEGGGEGGGRRPHDRPLPAIRQYAMTDKLRLPSCPYLTFRV